MREVRHPATMRDEMPPLAGRIVGALSSPRWRVALVYFGFVAVSAVAAMRLGQDVNWDLRNYHVYNALSVVEGRTLDIGFAQVQSWNAPYLDVVLFLLAKFFTPRGVSVVVAALEALSIIPVYLLARRYVRLPSRLLAGRPALPLELAAQAMVAIVAGALILTGAVYWSELGNGMGDSILAPLILGSVCFAVHGIEGENRDRSFLASGVLLGAATGFKLTELVFMATLAFTIVVFTRRRGNIVWYVVGCGAGTLLTGGLWFLHLFRRFRNPFFPFFNGIFKSSDWQPIDFSDDRFVVRSPSAFVDRITGLFSTKLSGTEIPFRDPRLAVGLVLAVLFVVIPGVDRRLRFLSTFFLASLPVWAWISGIHRYIIPLEILTVVLVLALPRSKAIRPVPVATVLATLGVALLVIGSRAPDWGRLPTWQTATLPVVVSGIDPGRHKVILVGGGDPIAYIAQAFPRTTAFLRPDSNFINPTMDVGVVRDIRERVNRTLREGGSIGVLSSPNTPLDGRQIELLKAFNLTVVEPRVCGSVTSPIEQMQLCDATAIP